MEKRQKLTKKRKRIEAVTHDSAFAIGRKKSKSKKDKFYHFNARDAVIGAVILNRFEDPMQRLERF